MPKRLGILVVTSIFVVALLAGGSKEPQAPSPETVTQESDDADLPAPELPPDPFGPDPRHPPEVTRLLNLFPAIPADGTLEDTVAFLGLSTKDMRGDLGEGVDAIWTIAPGYSLQLWLERDKPGYRFDSAVFMAQGKPGRPADEWNIVYPWRRGNRMVTSPTWRPWLPD